MEKKRKTVIPVDSLMQLRHRMDSLPPKSQERASQINKMAELYAVSTTTVYRALKDFRKPRSAHRSDYGKSRILPQADVERYCELIAAFKLRTTNKQGRHISTARIIELMEDHGIETSRGLVKIAKGLLSRSTVDRYLAQLKLNQPRLLRESPAVRFQAEYSNDCWQFDMSHSDLKHIEKPEWINPNKGEPTLMLFSVVDDRSGMAYVEYRCVYGEDAESALRFLFNAMAAKENADFPLQGRPKMIYLDNGPVAKSQVFQNVMLALDIQWQTHLPPAKDEGRTTARSKGKVERPFRTIKEAHETLYHFNKPETEKEANEWLMRYLVNYNDNDHRSESHSRREDWLLNLPNEGYREMCTWEQYCRFAREPERRRVGIDARITVGGTTYEVEPDMAGEWVILLWGLFDDEVYVEFEGGKYGPYYPISGPIPLHRYRAFKQTKSVETSNRIRKLAKEIGLPISAMTGGDFPMEMTPSSLDLPSQPFDPEAHEYHFSTLTAAKLAIADELAVSLTKLPHEDKAFIDQLLSETLNRSTVLTRVRGYFRPHKLLGEENAR